MPRAPRRLLFLYALAAWLIAAEAFGQQVLPQGNEFQVNTYTDYGQAYASVAAESNGDFVVVWQSQVQDGASLGVFGRRFSVAGVALASEFQVSVYTVGFQYAPRVAADGDGDFVVVWRDGDSRVLARRFSSAGAALGGELEVIPGLGYGSDPVVAVDDDGDFVVAWVDYAIDGDGGGILARRFSSAGAAVATEFQVNLYTPYDQRHPEVSADIDGDFVVAWDSVSEDGDANGVFARRFSSSGVALGSELQINAYTTGFQTAPVVDMEPGGDFVVIWDSRVQDGEAYGVFGRRFSSSGTPLTGDFQVNAYTASYQRYPSVAANDAGRFVVSWMSLFQDGSFFGVFARRFSSAGVPVDTEFQVSTYTSGQQRAPSVAIGSGASFVVVWQSDAQDGSFNGLFGQRFSSAIILDIDGDGTVQPLTDLLLGLRYAFGFRGATLTTGAVAAGCTRCDAPAIEAYLAGLTQ